MTIMTDQVIENVDFEGVPKTLSLLICLFQSQGVWQPWPAHRKRCHRSFMPSNLIVRTVRSGSMITLEGKHIMGLHCCQLACRQTVTNSFIQCLQL